LKAFLLVCAALLVLGALFAIRIALLSYLGERSDFTRWPSPDVSRHPERTGILGLAEISFSAPGEPTVAAWYAPSRNKAAIVLVHGTGTDRSSLLAEARLLTQGGFGVLALDLPGQGVSEGATQWGVPERHAIMAAVDWLSRREEVDPGRIGGYGHSMGAYVLTQAAVLDKRLRAVVLAGCPNNVVEQNWVTTGRWGLLSQLPTYWALRVARMPLDMVPKDVIGAIAPRALLIVNGELDQLVPPYMARQLFAAAGEPKELWIMPGTHHSDYSIIAPEDYGSQLLNFFRNNLLK
jgi:dipeptidyl aminopeptidase/acylaminoacyl peptidase